MIYFFTPFSFQLDLGSMYNHYCQLVPNDEDWICMIDHDVNFLNTRTAYQIQDITRKYPETGLFTCVTNRVGNPHQCYKKELSMNPDINYHKDIADKLMQEQYLTVIESKRVISGLLMVFKKSTWKKVGGFKPGILTVDNDFSQKIMSKGLKVQIMIGVYVFHYYRLKEGKKYIKHLIK